MKKTCGGIGARLRNKKTGLVHEVCGVECEPGDKWSFLSLRTGRRYHYDSMGKLKQEWEYPEHEVPK